MVGLSVFFACMLLVLFMSDREVVREIKIKGTSFFDGLTILQKKDGAPVWTLTARKAYFRDGEKIVDLKDISMLLHKNGMVFYADKGTYDLSNRNFNTECEIRAKVKDYTIKVDSIDYEDFSGEFKTEGRIQVEGKKFKVDGKGMKVDSGQKVRILKDVKATFYK